MTKATPAMSMSDFIKAAKSGKIFACSFIKRQTGEERRMVCRTGVKVHLTGGGARYNAAAYNLLTVWDFTVAGYRNINLDWMLWIKVAGKLWMWNEEQQVFVEPEETSDGNH